ncbi:uncharacterized protein LOC100903910 [Galendromus occidentalis]|uniref:Uncharacterized protein LOC100903910 n=1 Tax=Galendromus occidentalis TaxID=34638 RepID=A0AAJ7L624_9ACAR|nr:uncharacterized protein LOC100903910 [Galendromus occidentalis]
MGETNWSFPTLVEDDSVSSSTDREDCLMTNLGLAASPRDELLDTLRREKEELERRVEATDAHVDKLERLLCKLRNGILPEKDEEDEEWLQMHSHCTSSTCWRQKYAESLMQLRAALVDAKSQLEKQPYRPGEDGHSKQADLRMIEESLRSIGPIEPPTRNLKRSSDSAGEQPHKVLKLTPSQSRSSLSRRPFFKRMINIFRRYNPSPEL